MRFITPLKPEGDCYECTVVARGAQPAFRFRWCWLRFVLSVLRYGRLSTARGQAFQRGNHVTSCYIRVRIYSLLRLNYGYPVNRRAGRFIHTHDEFVDSFADPESGRRHTHMYDPSQIDPWTNELTTPEQLSLCWCRQEKAA